MFPVSDNFTAQWSLPNSQIIKGLKQCRFIDSGISRHSKQYIKSLPKVVVSQDLCNNYKDKNKLRVNYLVSI